MTSFMTEDFLLDTEFARRLYHDYAKDQPIFDYHCHLPPQQVAENYRFKNLYDIWLKGDHYKWRAMRTNGVPERLCTGDASDREKFDAWAATVPHTIGNPLYHWTHLELRRPFGITGKLLSPSTADEIWDQCNDLLAQDAFSARGIMKQMNVKMVGTTDDPIDSLEHHAAVAKDNSFDIKVLPSWRPDKAFNIELATFNDYMAKLGEVSDTDIRRFADLQSALTKRLDHFAAHGCKVSDHALDVVLFAEATDAELDDILARRLAGETLSEHEVAQFKTAVLVFLGAEYARRGWVQQYHIGALRNNNLRQFKLLGPDVGFDSINDRPMAEELSKLLSKQNEENLLPKTILYCLNPRDNEVLGTMIGNFQGEGMPGKMQFGSGWWFNDQKDGMERQMTQLAQLGLLSRFVGMLTDSRSFLSYTRHEYFRRILCQMIGRWVAAGEAPADIAPGEHVHAHNTRTNLSDLDAYRYQPDLVAQPPQPADREVQIYRRANGDVGVRNELWILPTVGCVNAMARQMQNRFLKETYGAEDIDGVHLFSHTYGCSQLGDDHINTRTMLQNMVRHPNAGAVLVVGLGCENNQVEAFRETLGEFDPQRVHFMVCQHQDDEVEAGVEHLHQLYEVMRQDKRQPGKLSELKFGLECGGSDGLSGITANPMLGRFSDYVIANGGTTVLTEVPEMFGAEQLLMSHCRDEATFDKLVTMVNDFKQYFIAHDQPIYENPSPGNKAGGITTLEDKSLGCTQKAGSSQVVDVLRYGERLKVHGLNLLSAPGNDAVATSALAGAGCHMVLFSTGRGTPYGGFVPTVKIATNSELAAKKKHWIDFDAGQLLHGKTMPQLLEEFVDAIVAFANGKPTCNEQNDFRELAIFKSGVTL
ncbi:glucuronate isomerase [Klebsiella pneumoniae]|nr:glucuronate isomerase [Klebsiella pneumoniae]